MEIRCKEVIDPADGDLLQLAAVIGATFADDNLWLGLTRLREFLVAPGTDRSFHVVVAREGEQVLGGTLFSCVRATGAGFSEYMVLTRQARGKGISRRLVDFRKAVLDRAARRFGHAGCPAILIEVENPERLPAAFLEQERQTAMDALERWRYFHHMGFRRLDFAYHMPPLRPDLEPVEYLDLLCLPWSERLALTGEVTAEFLADSVAPTWQGWSPDRSPIHLENLRRQLDGRPVKLLPLIDDTERRYAES